MDIRQALAVSDLGAGRQAASNSIETLRKAEAVARQIFAAAVRQGARLEGTPESWCRDWLQSERFVLLDVPLHYVACPIPATDRNKILGCLRASAESVEPIVVDMNKNKIGRANAGYYPAVIVVSGSHQHSAARLQGRERIKAWVGELAAQALGLLSAKDGAPLKDRQRVDIKAATEDTVKGFKSYQATSIEAAMQIFGAGGGMGGPGSSLGNGSGPGPSMVMKPMPEPGGTTKPSSMPAMKSKGRKLKATGFYGYPGGTATDTKHMKPPAKSELEDPTVRHKGNYTSEPDIEGLKGAAAKVAKIVTHYKRALRAGYRHAKHELEAVAPPGGEHVVKGLKKHFGKDSSSPYKIAWWLHNKQKKQMAADFDPSHKDVDLHERPPHRKNPATGV